MLETLCSLEEYQRYKTEVMVMEMEMVMMMVVVVVMVMVRVMLTRLWNRETSQER